MKTSRRRWRRAAQVMGAAMGLSGATAQAGGGYFNPGLLLSWTFGRQGGFGLGAEVSVMHYPSSSADGPFYMPLPVNYGAFLQAEKLWGEGRFFRASAGVQASPRYVPIAGGELGLALQQDSRGWSNGVHGGVFGSMGVVGLALRGTFWGPGEQGGVQPALVLTVKAPMGYGCPPLSCVVGRPLRVEDGYLLPEVVEGGGAEALHLLGRLARVGTAEQEALASEWLLAARGEYASVPAFLQLAGELEVVGAPDALIDAALTAAEDEVRHARVSFALASAYAEAPRAPAVGLPFGAPRRAPQEREAALARLAVESWVDGCVGEGLAAARAQEAASTGKDGLVAAAQATIAQEESTHAELGWGVVRWCLHEGGAAVRRALEEAQDRLAEAEGVEGPRARLRRLCAEA